jgi:hypothetical protein
MNALRPVQAFTGPIRAGGSEAAVKTLQIYAVTLMVFPSDTVIRAVGASGYVASLVAMFIFVAWIASVVLGLHDPRRSHNPVRAVLGLMWVVTLVSYVVMHLYLRPPEEQLAADRWLMELIGTTGVIVVAGGMLTNFEDIRRAQRAIVWGGGFCGLLAALQFWFSLDLTWIVRAIPGFTTNGDNSGIVTRDALNRVSGTSVHPIELGTVSAMLLPLAFNLVIYDKERRLWRRWLPALLILSAIATSVSRSAILACVVSVLPYILLLPPAKRLAALALAPLAVVGAFVAIPGLVTTLSSFFTVGSSDPSIASRVDDYPFVERAVALHPWVGQGGGSFVPANAIQILDNQYLKTAIELGLVGLLIFILILLVPAITALTARQALRSDEARSLCAGLAGACLAAGVASFTFDSWSFPMFTGVHAYLLGLTAACWGIGVGDARLLRSARVVTVHSTVGVY